MQDTGKKEKNGNVPKKMEKNWEYWQWRNLGILKTGILGKVSIMQKKL